VAILLVFLTVVFPQEFLFAQYLPVDQPNAGNEVDQHNPIGEHQYLSEQHAAECDIKWIPAERKYARGYELVGMIDVDADAKTLAKPNQAEQEEDNACEAKDDSDPGNDFGLEEPLGADGREVECGGKHGIEIEKGERQNQEVRLVNSANMHGPGSCSSHQDNSGQYHSE
jgi:hypothetical protein